MPGFLVGIVIGAVAAAAYMKKKGGVPLASSMGSSASRGSGPSVSGGRVDELSSAANMAVPENPLLNAGDGTPAGDVGRPLGASSSTVSPASPTTGLSESRH
jgi:hypothetical protein